MTTSTQGRSLTELERLALAAFVDPLTGLRNRRGLDQDLAQRIALAKRGGRPLTVVVGDLDGLKQINDRDGHAAGDLALRSLGAALESARRAGDTAYRIGGDEFLLLLADTDATQAEVVISRVRANAPAFSCGMSMFPTDGHDASSLMEVADQRLLSGRRHTRSRRADQRARSARTGPRRGRSGALALVSLTVTALLGGAGVGFAAQNVMSARDNAATTSPDSLRRWSAVAEPAVGSRGEAGPSAASAVDDGADGPTRVPILADQLGVAATLESSPVDDADKEIDLPPLTTVVEIVEETLEESTDEPPPADEAQKGPRTEAGEARPGGGPKKAAK